MLDPATAARTDTASAKQNAKKLLGSLSQILK